MGLKRESATKEVLKHWILRNMVIIGPSNPITSIGPILALKGMRELLAGKK